LDTFIIISLFLPNGIEGVNKSHLKKEVTKNKDKVWGEILRLSNRLFKDKNYQFDHQMQTDGISAR
jgi:hypothetical protein